MQTIELECPGCKTMLELDAGFAGGVCRCSQCGTLMTVPADPSRERAERLVRPERPDRPDAPGGGGTSASGTTEMTERPDEPAAAGTPSVPADEVFTTASGKTVRIKRGAVVTAKTKKKAVKAGVIGAFVAVMAVVVVGTVLAAVTFFGGAGKSGPDDAARKAALGGYDPNVNPYKLNRANILGVPLVDKSAVLIDTSSQSSEWLSLVKHAMLAGSDKLPASSTTQVIFWQESGAYAYPEKPGPIGKAKRTELDDFMANYPSRGAPRPERAVELALEGGPEQIVLVTNQLVPKPQIDNIEDMIKEKGKGVRVDVIMIGEDWDGLRELAERHNGTYTRLPASQIQTWYREAD